MRKTLTTAALLLALSYPALAGDMNTPGSPSPTPQPIKAYSVPELAGDETLDGETATDGISDALTQLALGLLAVLPALL